jgi:predicted RNase H-like HicB family nuclease
MICYAEGHEGTWAAYCPDLDLAVQGRTFEEVYGVLGVAIRDYVEAAAQEKFSDRDRLLSRKAPLWERLCLYWRYL